ncbi:MAG: ferrous iron transporter B [Acidobacteriota bacterium]
MVAVKSQLSEITVCLVGMPNAGKTTLMNTLTGSSFHTANYPGVTVTLSRGKSRPQLGAVMNLIDLPGVHSPISPSPEEELSCQVLEGRHPKVQADAFVLVIDATQLERHLKFASYAARQGKPLVIALTMTDMLTRLQQSVDAEKLAKGLGVTVVTVDGRSGQGAAELLAAVRNAIQHPNTDNRLAQIPLDTAAAYQAIRQLLTNSDALHTLDRRQGLIDNFTARIDRIVLHRYLGFPIFFAILAALFAAIFWAAQPFMDGIEAGFAQLGEWTLQLLPEGMLARFIAEGIIGGVGSVAVFFPQIVILFFLMTLLEDSGYLARGAALVDRPLSYLGLHGRSFVPMLSGFACAIPAVLAARAIPSRRERLLTIWILPLMSCSARLPVYALLLAALLPTNSPWKAGLGLAGIYISSLLVGATTAGIMSRIAFRHRSLSLLAMELPAYRTPQWKPIARLTWTRAGSYLQRAGLPILIISAILWLLSNFGLGIHQPVGETAKPPSLIVASDLAHSFTGKLGQSMEPLLRPMGVDWRVGVGLISAFAAREVFVSAMAIIFQVADDEESGQAGLLQQMRSATFPDTTQPIFTTASIIGLIVFFFFSLQCLSTVSVVRRETNSWRIAGLQLLFYTGLGYLLAVSLVQGLRLFGVQ